MSAAMIKTEEDESVANVAIVFKYSMLSGLDQKSFSLLLSLPNICMFSLAILHDSQFT